MPRFTRPSVLALLLVPELVLAQAPRRGIQPADSGPRPRRIAVGQTLSGALSGRDSIYRDTTYYQPWELTTTPGLQVTIDLESAEFDPYLLVEGGELGRQLTDDDRGPGCGARITYVFAGAGPYRVVVNTTTDPARQTGRYTLSVTQGRKDPRPGDECQPPQRRTRDRAAAQQERAAARAVEPPAGIRALAVGASVQGELTRGDFLRAEDSTYAQAWTLEAQAGQAVTVDLESDDFDPYVFLTGPGIDRNLHDDDSGGRCNARLTAVLSQGGAFTIVVNSANKFGTGRFTLSVTAGAKPKSLAPCDRIE